MPLQMPMPVGNRPPFQMPPLHLPPLPLPPLQLPMPIGHRPASLAFEHRANVQMPMPVKWREYRGNGGRIGK